VLIEALLMFIPMIIIAALLWTHADRIYQWHSQTKKENPFLFKITGFNEKYIDKPELWIKHLRMQLILFTGLFTCILFIFALFL